MAQNCAKLEFNLCCTFFIRCKTLSNFLLLSLSLRQQKMEQVLEWMETNENWIVAICPRIKGQKMRHMKFNHLQIVWEKTSEKMDFVTPTIGGKFYGWESALQAKHMRSFRKLFKKRFFVPTTYILQHFLSYKLLPN